MSWILLVLKWLGIGAALLPFVGAVGGAVIDSVIRPRMIPREEIDRLADDVIQRHPHDPEEWAFMEEHAAWHRSLSVEQGKWHRVRKAIRMSNGIQN